MNNNPKHTSTKGEKAILSLYFLFFFLWCSGYFFGLLESTPTLILGLPVWFIISCLVSFLIVFICLVFVAQRYFS